MNYIFNNLTPPILKNELIKLTESLRFLLYNKKYILRNNKSLNGVAKGKRAFLLATGPSLKEENLKVLEGEDCFSVSNFYLHQDLSLIKPKMHFFTPYHPPLILNNYLDWLRQADRALPIETEIFLGHSSYDNVITNRLFPNRKIHYLYLVNNLSFKKVDLTKPILSPMTVPLMALPVMIYMGYKEIYLLGCDHNTLRDFNGNVEHFYDNSKDFRKNSSDANSWLDVISAHEGSLQIFRQYQIYKDLLYHLNYTKIINLSKRSWLDLFPFANLTDIL